MATTFALIHVTNAWKLQEVHGYGFREPDAVLGPEEPTAVALHLPGLDHQHHGPAAALADASGCFTVGRQVDVMPVAANQALLAD